MMERPKVRGLTLTPAMLDAIRAFDAAREHLFQIYYPEVIKEEKRRLLEELLMKAGVATTEAVGMVVRVDDIKKILDEEAK